MLITDSAGIALTKGERCCYRTCSLMNKDATLAQYWFRKWGTRNSSSWPLLFICHVNLFSDQRLYCTAGYWCEVSSVHVHEDRK